MKSISVTLLMGVVAAALGSAPAATCGFIYVTDISANKVGKYNLDGAVVNASFISGLGGPLGIAVTPDGTKLYITKATHTIGTYDAVTGATLNAQLIETTPGFFGPDGIALSEDGSTLYVTYFFSGGIGKYDAITGAAIDETLIPEFARSLAVSGSNLYITNSNGVGKYTTSGDAVNAALVTGLNSPSGIAVSDDGKSLFVYSADTSDFNLRIIGQYDAATGAAIDATLVSGLVRDNYITGGLSLYGSHLLATDTAAIGKFTTSGATVSHPLISGFTEPYDIAVSLAGHVPIYGDIDGDFDLDASDYQFLSTHLHADVTSLTTAQSYVLGDLTGDLRIDGRDFVVFRTAFDAANGVGSFVAMLKAIPEPSSEFLFLMGYAAAGVLTRSGRLRRNSFIMP